MFDRNLEIMDVATLTHQDKTIIDWTSPFLFKANWVAFFMFIYVYSTFNIAFC